MTGYDGKLQFWRKATEGTSHWNYKEFNWVQLGHSNVVVYVNELVLQYGNYFGLFILQREEKTKGVGLGAERLLALF